MFTNSVMIQGMSFGNLMKLLGKTTLNLQKTVVTICCLGATADLCSALSCRISQKCGLCEAQVQLGKPI